MGKADSDDPGVVQSGEATELTIPSVLPLLPVRDIVVFPYMIVPLFVGRESSISAVNEAITRDRFLLLLTQKDPEKENPTHEDLYTVGVVVTVVRMLRMPDDRLKVLVQGICKAKAVNFRKETNYYHAQIERIAEPNDPKMTMETEALVRNVKSEVEKAISLGKALPQDLPILIDNMDSVGKLADLVASNMALKVKDAQEILTINDPLERLKRVDELLNKELELLTIQQKIHSEAHDGMTKSQRDYYLREQLKAIQKELGDDGSVGEEVEEFRKKVKKAKMPKEIEKETEKQMRRLEKMYPEAAEATIVRTYLEWMTEIPWGVSSKDNLDLKSAKEILDEDHYDLEKVKERILEYLGVRKLKKNRMKGPILCFVGPPGVGKTSLGKSIARAMNRKFVRIALGGVRDEAEIRGHRRTYIGALPGRIIQGLKQAGTNNPVFMIDEIDKLGSDFRGDPSSALLEVLDPEQNVSFVDHYLAVPFDLGRVMFITTANLVDTIPSALMDRMEVIRIPGYTEEEKLDIVKKYIIPRQLEEHGISEKWLEISDDGIRKAISQYTREAGLRNIEREIATISRKVAKKVAEGEKCLHKINAGNLHKYLGIRKFLKEVEETTDQIGVATGLAWTQSGGELLYVEVTLMHGKGKLTLTGQLGDVMKESAKAALSYARSKAKELGLKEDFFFKTDFHIHVPAGAIPKDGPSAGITMAVAVISALTRIPIRHDLAMTGEITLRGRVLPIGGLKEKTLAAKRAGIINVLIPAGNKKDLEEIPPQIRKKMNFIFAEHMDEVINNVLARSPRLSNSQVPAPRASNL
ncbi:MAG: endopeptidase La [Nitrospinae bacterium]|nr:endopeptidase La [Nitrospinota bacterium]